jgi:hypothetical protein
MDNMKKYLHIIALHLLVLVSSIAIATNDELLNKETQINIYPNPVMSGQEVKLEMEIDENTIIHIYVYDFAGKLVKESTNLRLGFGELKVSENLMMEQKGLYLIKIITEDEGSHLKQSKVKKLYVI